MPRDSISAVLIDDQGQLHIVLSAKEFPFIYREGMDVSWDVARRSLHSPLPRQWSYPRFFEHILDAAQQQGCELALTEATTWINIDEELIEEIRAVASSRGLSC